ncbi:rhodanese-like domain-containing protein [Phytoactinopolyspora alkaliphila]|uniref:Rhodanese-like domain-containing protein n=1 Tax=Phytoactinopolyspora alkaliphila TaxID=1783498 RepID=A0A6N9YS45_9ACTN|nr:rhodanese-like domain-containing protein [Phytoactinopolyspora alkaliphila]NED97629.1 rhodanese-like domain-containing protein [Phytoactinopolyspora alkaliphila]
MSIPDVDVTAVPDDGVLLDVREPDEWQAGHVPGAVHIPLRDLPGRLDDIPDEDPVYVVCKVGGRSAHAAAWLNSIGRSAVNVAGGMESWHAAGRPMTSENGNDPVVA